MTATGFHHSDRGTDESVWRRHADSVPVVHFADLPVFSRTVVVAPHPDDESLGAGGLIAGSSAAGTPVVVIVATDGDAADGRASLASRRALATRRRHEVTVAIRALSSGAPVEVCFLGLPDGGLIDHADELDRRVAPLLGEAGLIVAPWPGDGHPDHTAVGEAVRRVAGTTPRLEYPVWAWHWGTPEELAGVPLIRVPLSPSARRAKHRAIRSHRSQVTGVDPILTPEVLAHFDRDHELFVVDESTRRAIRPMERSSSAFFDAMYRTAPGGDPWDFGRSGPEQRRFDRLVECLDGARFRSGLELGCSTGELTRRLALHVDRLLAVDTSSRAIEVAGVTLDGATNVDLRVAHAPEDLRSEDAGFDLLVVAEIGYYFSESGLAELVEDLAKRSVPGATLLASHWTGSSDDHRLDAPVVHRIIDSVLGWPSTRTAVAGDHLMGVWTRG